MSIIEKLRFNVRSMYSVIGVNPNHVYNSVIVDLR